MATVNGKTAEKMQEIANESIVAGFVDLSGQLLLERRDGTQINAGNIMGPKGDPGLDFEVAAGFVKMFAGSVPPPGYMICNGASLLRAQYPELYTTLGTTYGSVDSLHFNIPDLRGRVIVGHDPSQTEFINLGKLGGSKVHTLTIAEMPSHSHPIASRIGLDDSNWSFNGGVSSDNNTVGPAFSSGSAGGDGAHNNLQPYNTMNYIISLGVNGPVGGGDPVLAQYLGRGATAERDALFGIPGTAAQRATLANAKPTWWNTDTNRMETYYAITGTAGLVVPGLWTSSFSAGWYSAGPTDWGGKSGPQAWAVYKANWARGHDSGGAINSTVNADGILIGLTGIYECRLHLRGGAAGNADYAGLALNGDRTAFENRSNTPMTGIWTHDHPTGNNGFSNSYYLGQLLAGDLVTGGPYNGASSGMTLSAAPSGGMMTIRRVA